MPPSNPVAACSPDLRPSTACTEFRVWSYTLKTGLLCVLSVVMPMIWQLPSSCMTINFFRALLPRYRACPVR